MLIRLRAAAPILVVLLGLIVLSVRLSGAHAHRDLEPTQSGDGAQMGQHVHGHYHDAHETVDTHAHAEGELDIKLDGPMGQADRLSKVSSLLLCMLFAVGLFVALSHRSVPRPPDRSDLRPLSRSFWRPQLRGPPSPSIA